MEEDSPIVAPCHILITYLLWFYFSFIFTILEVSCVWLEWLKSLCIKGPNWGTPVLVPQILSNFIFSWYFPILKFWYVYLKQLKSLNFGIFVWEGSPLWYPFPSFWRSLHFSTLEFCQILSFLCTCLSWKFHASSVSGKKVWGLVAPFERDTLIVVFPNFVMFCLSLTFIYSKNSTCLAWVAKKFEFWQSRFREISYFGTPKFLVSLFWYPQIKYYLIFIIVNPENFMCLTCKVKKFWILAALFVGDLPFWYPKIWSYFSFIFTYLKNFVCPA